MISWTIFLLATTAVALAKEQGIARKLRGSPHEGNEAPPSVDEVIKAQYTVTSIFDATNSYQSFALAWTRSTSEGMHESRILQRYSLACIYYATNNIATSWTQDVQDQEEWKWSDGWLEDGVPDECSWHGVDCDHNGLVKSLDLQSNKLTGSFPNEVGLMRSSLLKLDLKDNLFFNDGLEFVSELVNLQELVLSNNAIFFEYGLPTSLQSLTNLRILDLSYCLMWGTIAPDFFIPLGGHLEYVDLSGNSFSGELPVSLADLWALESLFLSENNFEGSLDPVLKSGLPALKELWCNDNRNLNAGIPPEVKHLSKLKSLNLSNCNLGGEIPDEVGDLDELEELYLAKNNLSGVMPNAVCEHTLAEKLVVSLEDHAAVECDCCTCLGDECDGKRI